MLSMRVIMNEKNEQDTHKMLNNKKWDNNFNFYDRQLHVYEVEVFKLSPYDVFVRNCQIHLADEKLDKRFMFDIQAIEKGASSDKMIVFTFQAMAEEDLEGWISVMGGQINISKPQISSKTEMQNELDETGLDFIKKCIRIIERRGLHEQGLYRIVGMQSKVNSVVAAHFDSHKTNAQKLSTPVDEEMELKTVCSALKLYLRTLKEPVFTFKLHNRFIEAAMIDDKADRIRTLHSLLKELPKANYELLHILMAHLHKVSKFHEKNLMTPVNLGVCFGPSLLRPEVETVSSIYDIKFRNAIVELIIIHYEKMFKTKLDQKDIDEMVDTNENGENVVANLGTSLSSLASMARRQPSKTSDIIETTSDIRRQGLSNQDFNLSVTNKHIYTSTSEDITRKDSSSSSSLESLSASSTGVQSLPSSNLFSSQTRSTSLSSCTRQASSEKSSRLSITNSPSSSKLEPTSSASLSIKAIRTPQTTSVTSKMQTRGVTLYQCVADNDSELSFNANEIVTQIRPSKEPGWVMGTINGKTGLIPENYINFTGGI
ncbi:unnamed protein product [Rotaria sp. Silwood1]|nr:unnamed protein product [Rotaria sp. Silwood1]